MTTFTIDGDNNITALPSPEHAQDALALGAQMFTNKKEFTKLASGWPGPRLVEIWNSFAGIAPFDDLKPVKKFTDRKIAANRIWDAIQRLAPVAQEGAQDAPETAAATTKASQKKNAPKATKGAKEASPRKDGAPREGSKKAIVLGLLRRRDGATLEEIMKETGWLAHSVRGFISGSLTRKMGLAIESSKTERGRTYRLAAK